MNSNSKPPNAQGKPAGGNKKPATIDLEAKKTDKKSETAASTASKKAPESAAKPAAKPAASSPQPGKSAATASTNKPGATPVRPPQGKTRPPQGKTPPHPAKNGRPDKPQPKQKKSRGGGLLAGIVGATLAVAGLGGLGLYEGASKLPIIGTIYGGDGNLAQLGIDTGQSTSGEAGQSETSQPSAQLDELVSRIDAIEANASQGGETGGANVEALEAKIAELTSRIDRIGESAEGGAAVSLDAINTRLDKLEEGGAGSQSTENGDVATLTEAVSGLEERIAKLEAVAIPDIIPVQTGLEDLQSKVEETGNKVTENATRIKTLVDQSDELKETVASVKASEKVARSVAVGTLATALQNGDPLNPVLSSIATLGVSEPEINRLIELEKEGIPTLDALAKSLDGIADQVQNPQQDTSSGSLSDRLWANAQNLVTFRSSGPQEGDTPVAIISRVKDGVSKGELATAKSEWEKLPADIREMGKDWAGQLDRRLEALELQKALSDKLASANG